MTLFIPFKDTYDPLTTQGLNEKIINISEIVHITFYKKGKSPNKRITTIKARVQLKNGEIFEVNEDRSYIMRIISNQIKSISK